MSSKTKIIIVDDHQLVGNGVAKFFENHQSIEVIAVFNNPQEALSKVPILKPDILLTDLGMPELNGFDLIEKLKVHGLKTSYIILSMHLDQATIKKALAAGVSGYVPKNSNESEFVLCVEMVAKGESYFSQQTIKALTQIGKPIEKSNFSKINSLTKREVEILKLIAEGLSNKEIGEQLFIAVSTVETHRKALMEKLEVNKVTALVRIAVREGLV
ncbi:response regulator [Roseivirga echinicomitans]